MKSKLSVALLALTSFACSDSSPQTSRGAYTSDQVSDLEIAAAAGDRTALRELDIYFSMEGRQEDRDRIHQRRLQLRDPEAVEEEVDRLIGLANRTPGCAQKRALLNDARAQTRALAGVSEPNVEQDELNELIEDQLTSLRC